MLSKSSISLLNAHLPKRSVTSALLLLVLSVSGVTSQSRVANKDVLLPGKQLLLSGRFKEAAAWFHAAKQTHVSNARLYFYAGLAFTRLEDFSSAATELSEAVRLQPNRPEYRIHQANALARLKHKNEAIGILSDLDRKSLLQALAADDLHLLAEVYYRLEMNDEALQTLDALSKRQGMDSGIDLNLGQIYVSKRQYDLAVMHFQRSIQKKPENNAQAYFELGKILHQQNQLADARQRLLVAVKQSPERPEYLHRLGVVCLDLDQVEEALLYLKRAEPHGSELPKIFFALSRAFRAKGDSETAEKYAHQFQTLVVARKNLEEQELRSEQLIEQGEKELDAGRSSKARELFAEAVRVNPENWSAHGYLAEILLDSDEWVEARPYLDRMEAIDPASPVGNYLMATYHYRSRNLEQARKYAERVKAVHPGNAELRNLLGNIHSSLGRTQQALEEYSAAVRLAPDRSDYRHNLQTARTAQGDTGAPVKKR
jgi:Flp pilus assembly protein TadD